mgnify:CR=1 FL=1
MFNRFILLIVLRLIFIVAVGSSVSFGQSADYVLDLDSSSLVFTIDEIGKRQVVGTFESFEGAISSSGDITVLNGEINVDSLNTQSKMRDAQLKGRLFFNKKKYPLIAYEGEFVSENHVEGVLQVKGLVVPLSFDLSCPLISTSNENQLRLKTEFSIDRREWGIVSYKKMIKNEVLVNLDLVFIKL